MAQVVVASCATCAKTKYCAQKAQNRCTTSATLALVVQIVPLTGKTRLVAQVVVASCATCVTALTSLVLDAQSY